MFGILVLLSLVPVIERQVRAVDWSSLLLVAIATTETAAVVGCAADGRLAITNYRQHHAALLQAT